MKIYLVRHGHAVKRAAWSGWDDLRPLIARGEDQARGLQATFRDVPIRRIWSSPAVRCHETVERLAADRSLQVELDPRLGEDGSAQGVLTLLDEEPGAPILLCTSRSLISDVILALGVADDPSVVRCQKGSVWVLERSGRQIASASYLGPREIASAPSRGQRRAVLDIGSASMSLLVADVRREDAHLEPVLRERAPLGFGASLGEIAASDCERALRSASAMQAEAESVGSEELAPVATAGLRNAANGPQIADRIGAELGIAVRMLSGAEEARLVYAATRARLGVADDPVVSLDLGGGSLDLAAGSEESPDYEASEPLGVSRLRAELVASDPMHDREREALRNRVRDRLAPHADKLGRGSPRCIAAGGTVRALARLVQASRGSADIESVRGLRVSRPELAAVAVRLIGASHDERMKMPTVRPRRADLLPTGAVILVTLLEQLALPEFTVSDWGLREGVLLEGLSAPGRTG